MRQTVLASSSDDEPLSLLSEVKQLKKRNEDLLRANEELLRKNKNLTAENETLVSTIRLTKLAPRLVDVLEQSVKYTSPTLSRPATEAVERGSLSPSKKQMSQPIPSTSKQAVTLSTFEEATSGDPEDSMEVPVGQKTAISASVLARCSMSSPQKFVNDLLQAVYTTEHLATHSLSGTTRPGATDSVAKPAMEEGTLKAVIDNVAARFAHLTVVQIKGLIRQKLNNATKVWKSQR